MRVAAYIFGSSFSSLFILGYLFKVMHWPGARLMLIFSLGGIALIFIPIFAIYKYRKGLPKKKNHDDDILDL